MRPQNCLHREAHLPTRPHILIGPLPTAKQSNVGVYGDPVYLNTTAGMLNSFLLLSKKKKFSSTGEMVVRYRHLPHIPGDLNSVPETHISGKKEQLYKVVLCPLHAQDGLCAHIHTYTSSSSS